MVKRGHPSNRDPLWGRQPFGVDLLYKMKCGHYIQIVEIKGTSVRPKRTIAAYIVCIGDGDFVEFMYVHNRHTSTPEKKVDVSRLHRTLTERKLTHP